MKAASDPDQYPFDILDADRAALGARARLPAWLTPGMALLGGAWVASPAILGRGENASWFMLYVVGLLLIGAATRATGVRLQRMGARGWGAFAALVLAGLVLHSASLGLLSLGLAWWTAVPALLMAALTAWLVRIMDAARRSTLRRGD